MFEKLKPYFYRPFDAIQLGLFRIGFGCIQIFWSLNFLLSGKIERHYINLPFLIEYPGFYWVKALSLSGMYLIIGVMLVSAIGLTLGLYYRFSSIVFFLTYLYVFLISYAYHNHHYYLMCLLAGWLVVMDAHKWMSCDQLVRRKVVSKVIPFWNIALLRFQVLIVYFYGGVAKVLHPSWWQNATPIITRAVMPFYGHGLLWVFANKYVAYFLCWSGMIFDLSISGIILCKRTRKWGIMLMISFHTLNQFILFSPYTGRSGIGVFPSLGVILTLLFLEPSEIRTWFKNMQIRMIKLIEEPQEKCGDQEHVHQLINYIVALGIIGVLCYFPIKSWVSHTPQPFTWTDTLRVSE